jgi:multidrug resistance efflux pump
MKIDEIETHSEQIREILEKPPTSILKWGITILFIIVFALFFATWVIKYPTIIPSQITITSQIPPHQIIAQSSGKITQLFVHQNEVVNSNQTLAIIENTALYQDIQLLTKEVEKRKSIIEEDTLMDFQFKDHLKLGTVQPAYVNFKNAYEEYQEHFILIVRNQEIQILSHQINIHNKQLKNQAKQLKIYRNELELLKKDVNRDQELFGKAVISAKELDDKKRSLLTLERDYERVKNNRANVQLIISNLEKEINAIVIAKIETKSSLSRNLQETYEALKNSIATWKQRYLLVSPIAGRVSFFNFWAKNQHVNIGDEVLSVVPITKHKITGRMRMPIQNSGQVKLGQKVIIRLAAYPYQEYGMLIGTIKNISLLPSQETYAVEVGLPNHLTTTYDKHIELQSELTGTAEVVTEDLRLLERVFYQIRKIFNE